MSESVDLVAAVEAHAAQFNAGVESGDWGPFVAAFTEDARMTITNLPVGPYVGREEIARMYATQPPTEPMTIREILPLDDHTVRVRLTWASGRPSTMVVRWRGAMVVDVELTA